MQALTSMTAYSPRNMEQPVPRLARGVSTSPRTKKRKQPFQSLEPRNEHVRQPQQTMESAMTSQWKPRQPQMQQTNPWMTPSHKSAHEQPRQ